MANEPENLMLSILRRVDDRLGCVEEKVDRVNDTLNDICVRPASYGGFQEK